MTYMFCPSFEKEQQELSYFEYSNHSPLISIHVPTYKKKYLNIGYDFTINVVVLAYLQTFNNWELRLIDNHDGDLDLNYLLDKVENILNKKINRTKVLYQKSSNDSIGSKRNELIEHTTAPVICNWDDDDLYLPEYLFSVCKFYKENPHKFGVVVGRRWQYNLVERQRLIWKNTICNGAAYYVLRTDVLKQFVNVRYASKNKSEENIFLQELNRAIQYVNINEATQSYLPLDEQYVRIRFGGNVTDKSGWEHDIEVKKLKGGSLMEDMSFRWLFSKIPIPLHGRYRQLITNLQGDYNA